MTNVQIWIDIQTVIFFQFYQNKQANKQTIKIVFSITLTGDTFGNYYKRFVFMYDGFHQKVFN